MTVRNLSANYGWDIAEPLTLPRRLQGVLVRSEDLVGVAEIAARLALAQQRTVHDWRRRYDSFPEPIAKLTMGLVWSWPDVEAWAITTGRR